MGSDISLKQLAEAWLDARATSNRIAKISERANQHTGSLEQHLADKLGRGSLILDDGVLVYRGKELVICPLVDGGGAVETNKYLREVLGNHEAVIALLVDVEAAS